MPLSPRITGSLPFSSADPKELAEQMKTKGVNCSVLAEQFGVPGQICDLIKQMTSFDPHKRPKISDVLNHPALELLNGPSEIKKVDGAVGGGLKLSEAYEETLKLQKDWYKQALAELGKYIQQ